MTAENKKALWMFLALTFGITTTLLLVAHHFGFSFVNASIAELYPAQLIISLAMFVPGLSAIAVQKLILKKPLEGLGFVWGPWKMYVRAYLVILALFVVMYAVTWAFFLKPDWTLASFMGQYGISSLPFPAPYMIALFAFVTLFLAPIGNMIPALGEEIGWRGFLLPAIEPLGKVKAALLSGMIWALWHTPMILAIGFYYGSQALSGIFLHFALVTGLGIWMACLWFRTRSTVLSGFIHATFNAHVYGVWTMIFVTQSKLVVGAAGAIGASLCVILGAVTLYKMCVYNRAV